MQIEMQIDMQMEMQIYMQIDMQIDNANRNANRHANRNAHLHANRHANRQASSEQQSPLLPIAGPLPPQPPYHPKGGRIGICLNNSRSFAGYHESVRVLAEHREERPEHPMDEPGIASTFGFHR